MIESDTQRLSPPSRVFADVSNGGRPYAPALVTGGSGFLSPHFDTFRSGSHLLR